MQTVLDRLPASVLRSCSSSPEEIGSARRNPQPPTRRHPAPTLCCRSLCTSRAAAQTWQRKRALGGSSWWTWRAQKGHARSMPTLSNVIMITSLVSCPLPVSGGTLLSLTSYVSGAQFIFLMEKKHMLNVEGNEPRDTGASFAAGSSGA